VLAHARALLIGTPEGMTKYLHGDIRDVADLLKGAAEVLEFTEPFAVLILGVLGHIHDADEARSLVAQICARMPSGSYLVISDGTSNDERRKLDGERGGGSAMRYHAREPEEIASFFDGLEWVEPGFGSVSQWRPDVTPEAPADNVQAITSPAPVGQYGGVARKR
jgi:O-methyltransferase involved in polyketide biosynthesis